MNHQASPLPQWTKWLHQATSLVYLLAGGFLIYLFWARIPRLLVLVAGLLFLAYGVYRFFLVRRSFGRL